MARLQVQSSRLSREFCELIVKVSGLIQQLVAEGKNDAFKHVLLLSK